VFAECLIKHIDLMGRKGCNRTGLEFCKFLLSLDPENDPYGVLLRIDYYAVRAKEYSYLKQLVRQLPQEIYPGKSTNVSFLVLPNLLMSIALAKRLEYLEDSESRGFNTAKACCTDETMDKFIAVKTLEELVDGPAENLITACMLLYPDVFQRLIAKIGKQQMNVDLRKSWFKGTQT